MTQKEKVKNAWKKDFSDYWTKQDSNSKTDDTQIMDVWRECHFYGRRVLVEKILNIQEEHVFLELGCGEGWLTSRYENKCKTFGIDISDKFCKLTKKNAPNSFIMRGDIEQLPIADEFIDTCAIIYTFVSIPDKLKALKEINRVLKKDGSLIIFDPNHLSLRTFLHWLQLVKNKMLLRENSNYSDIKILRLNVLTTQSLSYFGFKRIAEKANFNIHYWRGNFDTVPFPMITCGIFSNITYFLLRIGQKFGCNYWGNMPIVRYFSDFLIIKLKKKVI